MSTATDSIIKELEEQKKKEGSLPELLEFYLKLLHIQTRVGQCIDAPSPSFSGSVISERMEQGKPLIGFDELAIDWSLLRQAFEGITAVFAEYPELFGSIPEQLRETRTKRFPTKKLVKAWFEGTKLPSTTRAGNVSEVLLRNIIHASLKPFLVHYSTVLLGLVEQENWRRGYCPICGGSPDFAFLDKEVGARWLLCSYCDAEWLFQRLECPYCGNEDQTTLSYFTDDKGLYRLYVCEKCHTYLKAIDLRCTELEVMLPLERIMTLDMDRQAQEQGYNPGRSKVSSMTTPQSKSQ